MRSNYYADDLEHDIVGTCPTMNTISRPSRWT